MKTNTARLEPVFKSS